jgi:hypothetical protein
MFCTFTWRFGYGLGPSFIKQRSLSGGQMKFGHFLQKITRRWVTEDKSWLQWLNEFTFHLAFPQLTNPLLSNFLLFLLFRENICKMERDYFCSLEKVFYHVLWVSVR